MSRVQLALNVANIDESIAFYSKLFATEPAKVRPGYANFAISEPPLKLVLIEDPTKAPGSLNHLGVELASTEEVASAQDRLASAGIKTETEYEVTCCYALQDKIWALGTGEASWEFYTVLADTEMPAGQLRGDEECGAHCCSDVSNQTGRREPACC